MYFNSTTVRVFMNRFALALISLILAPAWLSAAPILSELFTDPVSWGMEKIDANAGGAWEDSSGYAVTYVTYPQGNVSQAMVTDKMNLSSVSNPVLQVLYRGTCSGELELNVYYQDEYTSTWTIIQSLTPSSLLKTSVLSLNANADYKLAFEARANATCKVAIDAITVGSADEAYVTGVSFSNISNDLITNSTITQPIGTTPGTISLVLPYGTSRTLLTPFFSGSVGTFSPTGAQDLSTSKTYTISSVNATNPKTYNLSVGWTVPSTQAKLVSIKLCVTGNMECTDSSKITEPATASDTGTANVYMMEGTPITTLTPTIQISSLASSTLFPAASSFDLSKSGSGLIITVTAQDGTTKRYYRVVLQTVLYVNRLINLTICDPDGYSYNARSVWDPAQSGDTGRVVFDLPAGLAFSKYSVCGHQETPDASFLYQGPLTSTGTKAIIQTTATATSVKNYAISGNVRATKNNVASATNIVLYKKFGNDPGIGGTLVSPAKPGVPGLIQIKVKQNSYLDDLNSIFVLDDPYAYVNTVDGSNVSSWGKSTNRAFKITAENLSTSLQYNVKVVYEDQAKSTGLSAFIVWLGSLQVPGIIDTVAHTVKVQLPLEANLASMYCYLGAAQGAKASIRSLDYLDLSMPLTFTLTSPDGSASAEYTVSVTQASTRLLSATNPVKLYVSFENGIVTVNHAGLKVQEIGIYSVSGKLISNNKNPEGPISELRLQPASSGLYIIKVKIQGHGVEAFRLLSP